MTGTPADALPGEMQNQVRERIREERESLIYALRFASGIVKVGFTNNLKQRIDNHRTDSVFRDDRIVSVWESPRHVNAQSNELALIGYCASRWSTAFGREYFAGADFMAIVEYASTLTFERLTEAQLDEAVAEFERQLASGEIRARLERPKPKRGAVGTLRLRLDRLEQVRAEAGLSHEADLAAAMGFTPSTVNRVLNGKANPGPSFIASLLIALPGVTFDTIWEIVPEETA